MDTIHNAESGEADVSTVQHAASKIASLMDGTPSEEIVDDTQPEIEETAQEPQQEAAEEPTEEPVEQEEPEELVTRFSDLAEHLGVEESYLEDLIVPTKINGEEKNATIKELLASYQKGESADLKLMELADNRKQFDNERTQYTEAIQTEWGRIQALNTELQSMLTGDDDAQLQSMRHSDPAEYAARMAERQVKLQRAAKVQQEMQQANATKVNEEYSRRIKVEASKLMEAIPEWSDDKVQKDENTRVRSYLKEQGLQDFEIDGKFENGVLVHPGVIDHRAIVMARKAMLFDEARKGTVPKKARLKSLPKVGSGKPKSKGEINDKQKREVRAKAKSSGSLNDAAAVIAQLMNS